MPGLGMKFAPMDPRAHMYAEMALTLPTQPVDLRDRMPAVRNQGETSACTAFSSSVVAEATRLIIRKEKITVLSPRYLYRRTRELEGDFPNDEGAYIADALKVWNKQGVCPEVDAPWDEENINGDIAPNADGDAAQFMMDGYLRLGAARGQAILQAVLAWLSREQLPCLLGIQVYQSFMHPKSDNVIPIPARFETVVGGHAIACVGLLINPKAPGGGYLILMNSWSDSWGDKGFCFYPFQLVLAGLVTEAWGFRLPAPVAV